MVPWARNLNDEERTLHHRFGVQSLPIRCFRKFCRILIDDPNMIQSIHEEYFHSGANIATTCSYQSTIQGFMKLGKSRAESIALIKSSVRIACDARIAVANASTVRLARNLLIHSRFQDSIQAAPRKRLV